MTTISITPVTGNELHHHYTNQIDAQPCYVELDCRTGELSADWNGEIGNAVPSDVYHGHRTRWTIPTLKADAANALLEKISSIAQDICDGYTSHWDGNQYVAHLTDAAEDACDQIGQICDAMYDDSTDQIAAWDAGDWLAGIGRRERQCRELKITADTTDEQLDIIETRLTAEALNEGAVLDRLGRYLLILRDDARSREASEEMDTSDGDAADASEQARQSARDAEDAAAR